MPADQDGFGLLHMPTGVVAAWEDFRFEYLLTAYISLSLFYSN